MVDVCTPGQKAPQFTGLATTARVEQGLAHRSHAPPTLTATVLFTTLATAGLLASSYLQSGEMSLVASLGDSLRRGDAFLAAKSSIMSASGRQKMRTPQSRLKRRRAASGAANSLTGA